MSLHGEGQDANQSPAANFHKLSIVEDRLAIGGSIVYTAVAALAGKKYRLSLFGGELI
jgi:hypothetical protein